MMGKITKTNKGSDENRDIKKVNFTFFKNRYYIPKFIFLIAIFFLFSNNSIAQIQVIYDNAVETEINVCSSYDLNISLNISELYDQGFEQDIYKFKPTKTGKYNTLTLTLSDGFTFSDQLSTEFVKLSDTGIEEEEITFPSNNQLQFTFKFTKKAVDDRILINNIKIKKPAAFDNNSVYLQLDHDFIETDTPGPTINTSSPQNILELKSTNPTLSINDLKYCYNPTGHVVELTCSNTDGCAFTLQRLESGKWEPLSWYATSPSYKAKLNIGDKIRLITGAGRYSNEAIFGESYIENPIINFINGDPDIVEFPCWYDEIEINASYGTCTDATRYELCLDGTSFEIITDLSNIKFTPTANGRITLAAIYPDTTIVSNEIEISGFMGIPKTYELKAGETYSYSKGNIDMTTFFKEDKPLLTTNGILAGTIGGEPGPYQVYVSGNEFYKFIMPYGNNKGSNTYNFNTKASGVKYNYPNEVKFYYGVTNGIETCMRNANTSITVNKDKITIPYTSYCSKDESEQTISIDLNNDEYIAGSLEPGYSQQVQFKNFELKADNIVISNSKYIEETVDQTKKIHFEPKDFFTTGKDQVLIDITAYLEIKMFYESGIGTILPGWASSTSYNAGTLVQYNGEKYRAKEYIPIEIIVHDFEDPIDGHPIDGSDPGGPTGPSGPGTHTIFLYPPPTSSQYWTNEGEYKPVNIIEVSSTTIPFAKADFYIFKEKDDAALNLETKYCRSNRKIELKESHNYTIESIKNTDNSDAVTQNTTTEKWEFTPESMITSDISSAKINWVLHYRDTYGCPGTKDISFDINDQDGFNSGDANLGLDPVYCPKNTPIALKKNPIIDTKSAVSVSVWENNVNKGSINENFTPSNYWEYGDAAKTLNIRFTYRHINGCAYKDNFNVKIDPEYGVDKNVQLLWDKGGSTEVLKNEFCNGSYPYDLAISPTFTLLSISGSGISGSSPKYKFNPSTVSGSDTINVRYKDPAGCPYFYNHPVTISDNSINETSEINIETTYCAINDEIEIEKELTNNHSIKDVGGDGLKYEGGKLTFNPYRVLKPTDLHDEVLYNGTAKIDSATVYFLDDKNCSYSKSYPVKVSGIYAQKGELALFDSTYCANTKEITISPEPGHTILDIKGKGINHPDPDSEWKFNLSKVLDGDLYNKNIVKEDITVYLEDDNSCNYKMTYPIEVSSSFADTSGLQLFKLNYCAINDTLRFNTNGHVIDNITAKGLVGSDNKDWGYSPYKVLGAGTAGSKVYAKDTIKDLVTVYLKDKDQCAYKREYPVRVSGSYAVNEGLQSFKLNYCAVNDTLKFTTNGHPIDNITADGLVGSSNKDWGYSPFKVLGAGSADSKVYAKDTIKDLVTVYLKDKDQCAYKREYPISISGSYADTAGLQSFNLDYCAINKDFSFNLKKDHAIDTVKAKGCVGNGPKTWAYNPFEAINPGNRTGDKFYTKPIIKDGVIIYFKDDKRCVYKKNYPVTVSGSLADSSGLKPFDSVYCAVNKNFEFEPINGHILDTVIGKGFKDKYKLQYNPFRALSSTEFLDYGSTKLTDSITSYFRDENNCVYKRNYVINISGEEADTSASIFNLDNAYCKYGQRIQLLSSQLIDSIDAPGVYREGGNWFFDPSKKIFTSDENDQLVSMRYYYKDRRDCAWFKDYTFDVYARPKAGFNFDASTICFNDTTAFTDASVFNANASSIDKWEWDFGNGLKLANPFGGTVIPDSIHDGYTIGTYQSPKHIYKNPGEYQVNLKVTSDKGCAHDTSHIVIIGDYPKLKFGYDGKVQSFPTLFTNSTTNPAYDPVVKYIWDFDDPAAADDILEITNTQNRQYTFTGAGVHNVHLMAISNNNCISEDSIKIPIFPYIVVNNSSNYLEPFTNPGTGWLPAHSYIDGMPSGWKLSPVDGEFKKAPNTSGLIWLTGDPLDSIKYENSWLESPCFEFMGLDFPLLTMNIFQSIEKGRDGAVVQYSLDDGESWKLLSNGASLAGGINWYNKSGIVSNPGNQTGTGNIGWSQDLKEWQTARFPLDMVKVDAGSINAKCVRFRVAYSGDAGNAIEENVKGFAFDNFTLSSRNRIVMLEQFVNTVNNKALQESEEKWLNKIVEQNKPEVVDIRYHNYISHDYDPLYYFNTADISSRSFECGAWRAQLTMVDGIHRCLAPAEDSVRKYYNIRALKDKRFDISVKTEKVGDSLVITADVIKLTDTLITKPGSQKSGIRMAIIQKEYNYQGEIFKNIMIELLPNGMGNVVAYMPEDFPKGKTFTAKAAWKPSQNVTTIGNKFRLIVYVQGIWGVDEIHQVWFTDLDDELVPQVYGWPLGFDNPGKEIGKLNIYPMPASDKLTIEWSDELKNDVDWEISSVSGTIVKHGKMASGKAKEEIGVSDLPDGIYLLVLKDLKEARVQKRKIMVIK